MIIKFRNEALQYLYILTNKIPANSIAKVRKIKAVFLKIQQPVEAFERKWEELAAQAEHNKNILDGWKQTNQLKKNEKQVEEITGEIQKKTDEIKALKSTEVEAELNGDDVKFLMEEINTLLGSSFVGRDGNTIQGIQGKREIEVFDEVYTALETAAE